jgi:hypothetical protein
MEKKGIPFLRLCKMMGKRAIGMEFFLELEIWVLGYVRIMSNHERLTSIWIHIPSMRVVYSCEKWNNKAYDWEEHPSYTSNW